MGGDAGAFARIRLRSWLSFSSCVAVSGFEIFISGPVEINLIAIGGPRPVSKDVEYRLLSLLSSRAKALTRFFGPPPH